MTRFDDCLAFVLKREGGYSHNPTDRGGATNRGITQQTYDDWRVQNGSGRNPVSGISGEEVAAIYRDHYWRTIRGESLPCPLDLVVFDAGVQHGPSRASKWLQRVVGAFPDGKVGGKTLEAVEAAIARNGIAAVIAELLTIRDGFYREIIANDPAEQVFARGWANRMFALRQEIKKGK